VPPFLQLVRDGELTHSVFGRSGPARVKVYGDTAVVTARVANTAHHGGIAYEADERTSGRADDGRFGPPRQSLALRAEPDYRRRVGRRIVKFPAARDRPGDGPCTRFIRGAGGAHRFAESTCLPPAAKPGWRHPRAPPDQSARASCVAVLEPEARRRVTMTHDA
jgi:hypothetical protein